MGLTADTPSTDTGGNMRKFATRAETEMFLPRTGGRIARLDLLLTSCGLMPMANEGPKYNGYLRESKRQRQKSAKIGKSKKLKRAD